MTRPARTARVGWRSLQRVCPSLTEQAARALAEELGAAMLRFPPAGGWDAKTAADFISQCAHESGEFRYIREIWDGRGAQAGYWRRRDLGNWLPRHGYVYRGAGWIQTTGRANFKRAAADLGVTLGELSVRANDRRYASLLAAAWWRRAFPDGTRGLSVEQVTRRVNGGYNGLAERRKYYARAAAVGRYLVPRRGRS